ncbi:MAG: carotenoid oxygenase family protein, partial [Chloroflexi bacterium]|nr:carotenoid oxygenase family protein [Chloroflexota bacterium]
SDAAGRGSAFVVLDATDLHQVASVALPQRVPAGFHGTWLPDTEGAEP